MQRLERLPLIAKLHRQPIEQFGMRGQVAHAAKIVGRIDDPATEVIEPNTIHDRAPRKRVAAVDDPLGECGATRAF